MPRLGPHRSTRPCLIPQLISVRIYSMILQGVLFAFLCGVLDVGICAPSENDKIDPVDLNYFCFYTKEHDKNPSKSPILLIHGLTSNYADWNNIYKMLAVDTGRKVFAVDLRNHGESPWNNRTDVEALTVDIEHFLNEKNIHRINLIGHSLGGKTSVHFALKHPERVDSLVVEDMRPNGVTEKAATGVKAFVHLLQDAIRTVPENSSEDEAKEIITEYLIKTLADAGETLDGNPRELLSLRFHEGKWQYKMNLEVLVKAGENAEKILTPSSGLYTGPAMFIYGAESVFDVGGDESNIRKLFPQAQLVPVALAGHGIHEHYRKEFVDAVVKFLNNI